MRLLYKYLWKLTIKLKPIIDKFDKFLNIQQIKLQRKYQKSCKHKNLKYTNFLDIKLFVCQDCNAHGNLEYMTKKKNNIKEK